MKETLFFLDIIGVQWENYTSRYFKTKILVLESWQIMMWKQKIIEWFNFWELKSLNIDFILKVKWSTLSFKGYSFKLKIILFFIHFYVFNRYVCLLCIDCLPYYYESYILLCAKDRSELVLFLYNLKSYKKINLGT